MTGMETLDDLERTIARTLAAKADQIVVDEPGPSLLDGGTEAPAATVIHLTPPRPSRRRVLAVAAAAVLAVAGVAVGGRLLDDGDDATVPAAAVPAAVNGTREVGPIGVLPAGPPEGWRLTSLDVGTTIVGQAATQWQLFAPSGAPSPLDRGVLVSSASVDDRVVEGADRTVWGRPAEVGPPADPTQPVGAVTASWVDDGIVHDAVAVGLSEDDLVAFLDTLVPRPDPISGVDPPGRADLIEVGAATATGGRTSSATYSGPDGPGDVVRISASSADPYGGLMHRLDGRTDAAGTALVRRLRLADSNEPLLSIARPDGWTVDIVSQGSTTARAHPAVLSDLAATLEPVTRQQAIDLGLAQPVTATYELADGQAVQVHGTAVEDVALCLTTADHTTCGTAESLPAPAGLTTASLVLGDRWVIVSIARPGPADEVVVQTVPEDPRRLQGWHFEPVDAVATSTHDRVVVGLHEPPSDSEAVEVVLMSGNLGSGFTYLDPFA